MFLKIFKKILAGRKAFQSLFEFLNKASLIGMNIGTGSDPEDSGEKFALTYIDKRFKSENKIIVFDVGANVGHYALFCKKIFGNKAKIYCFEPSHKTFQKLKTNTAQEKGFNLYNFGLSDKNEKRFLFTNEDNSGLASVYSRRLSHFGIDMDKSEEIETKTLDFFCQKNKINHIHLLKLDVEGHEIPVLKGALKLLENNEINFIQFEFGGCNIDSRTFFQDFFYILKDKYKIYRILKDGFYLIKEYKEIYEVFKTTNFLAEKK